jgi:hypothetical protein
MLTLRLVLAWCKKYWGILLAVGAFILGFIIFRRGNVDVLKLIQGINDDHRKDVEAIKNKEKTIAEEKAKIAAEETKKLEQIDKKYDQLEKDLEEDRKDRVEEILDETNSNPDKLAEELAKNIGSKKI